MQTDSADSQLIRMVLSLTILHLIRLPDGVTVMQTDVLKSQKDTDFDIVTDDLDILKDVLLHSNGASVDL